VCAYSHLLSCSFNAKSLTPFLIVIFQRKSSPLSKLHTAPIASMPTAPMINTTASTTSKSKSSSSLRRGKWTVEEEAYVGRVIQDFNSGFLNAPAGTTLRSYLSEKLHCDPMRITKKFTGDACIGKRVFHPAVRCSSNAAAIDKAQVRVHSSTHNPLPIVPDVLTTDCHCTRFGLCTG